MSFQWTRDEGRGLTVVVLSGAFASDADSQAAADALRVANAWRNARVLVDIRTLDARSVPPFEDLASRVERWVALHGLPAWSAILAKPGAAHGIGTMLEVIAGRYRFRVAVFTVEAVALAWLKE